MEEDKVVGAVFDDGAIFIVNGSGGGGRISDIRVSPRFWFLVVFCSCVMRDLRKSGRHAVPEVVREGG